MSQSSNSTLFDSHKRPAEACTDADKGKLTSLIQDIQLCMLTTEDTDGRLHSRPMAINQGVECAGDQCAVWFFTYESSHKVSEMNQHNHQVNLSFSEPKSQSYVSVSGTGQLIKDRKEMEKRWQMSYKAWFPEGLDTPGIALLRVTIDKAEYWDAPSSTVAHAISFIKGQLTGKVADPAAHKAVIMPSGSKGVEQKETMRGEEAKMKDV